MQKIGENYTRKAKICQKSEQSKPKMQKSRRKCFFFKYAKNRRKLYKEGKKIQKEGKEDEKWAKVPKSRKDGRSGHHGQK